MAKGAAARLCHGGGALRGAGCVRMVVQSSCTVARFLTVFTHVLTHTRVSLCLCLRLPSSNNAISIMADEAFELLALEAALMTMVEACQAKVRCLAFGMYVAWCSFRRSVPRLGVGVLCHWLLTLGGLP